MREMRVAMGNNRRMTMHDFFEPVMNDCKAREDKVKLNIEDIPDGCLHPTTLQMSVSKPAAGMAVTAAKALLTGYVLAGFPNFPDGYSNLVVKFAHRVTLECPYLGSNNNFQ